MQSEVKKKTALYGVSAVLLALLLGAVCYNLAIFNVPSGQTPLPEQPFLQRFSSYEDLTSFLGAVLKTSSPHTYFNSPWRVAWEITPEVNTLFLAATGEAQQISYMATDTPEYSQTNIQVEGVGEADIVKTDGTYLYFASNNSIIILKAYPPEEATILSRISFNGTLGEIFLKEDKLVILGSYATYPYEPYYRIPTIIDDKSLVEVYDISDRSNPVLTRNFSVSGNYFDSRMIDEYVYLVVSQPAYLIYDTLILPKIYSEKGVVEVEATQIYYANVSDYSYAFTTVVAINVQNDAQEPTHETFLLGATSTMYVSHRNIYLTFWKQGGRTLIYRVRVEEEIIKAEASGEVPGSVLNQFSMDEYNGYFRLATTSRIGRTSQNNVYVLEMNLTTIGKLENIAPGETIYSVRFMGVRGYVVTFRQVDPFFTLDLEDPNNPEVLGILKIPGYSSYLHPYDENYLMGIGKDGTALKISLLDVSNITDPKEIDVYQIDGWSDSPVLSDHKTLLFDKSKDLLVIPVITYYEQGAYVFNITIQEGIALRGRITHGDFDYYYYGSYYVKRALYIDNVLYTISDKKVMMHNLETLDEINQIEF